MSDPPTTKGSIITQEEEFQFDSALRQFIAGCFSKYEKETPDKFSQFRLCVIRSMARASDSLGLAAQIAASSSRFQTEESNRKGS